MYRKLSWSFLNTSEKNYVVKSKSNELEKVFVPPFQSLKYIFVKTDQNSNLKLCVNDIAAKLKEERLYYLRSGTLPLLPH